MMSNKNANVDSTYDSAIDAILNGENIVDSIAQELVKTETQTLGERINNNIVELFNYEKHDGKKSGRSTGKALLLNQCANLAVIDIDVNKELTEKEKKQIRQSLIKKLDVNDVIVKTGSGGLHIYCNKDIYPSTSNRMIKCYTSKSFDIDLMSTVDESKRSLIVLPDSKVRKDHRTPISTYEFIRGSYDSVITRTIEQIIADINVTLTLPQNKEITNLIESYSDETMSDEMIVTIFDGLNDLEVHNDGGNRRVDQEVTLFTLFQAINALPASWHDFAYEYVFDNCKLTDKAKSNFENARSRYCNMKTSAYVLLKILKIHNKVYYDTMIKPMLHVDVKIYDIDLNEEFDFNTMIKKAEANEYKKNATLVLNDLSKVIRRIDSDTIMYIKKIFDVRVKRYTITFVSHANMKEMLKSIRLWRGEKDKMITAWNVFEDNAGKLSIRGVRFNTEDKKDFYCHFNGYKYNVLDNIDENIIKPFLSFINEVICSSNDEVYKYIISWIANMIQHPGVKNETAIVLKGLQGIGKNRFTDVLCELMAGYSEKNVTDIAELTGNFNSVVENKMLIVLNELRNFGDDRMANFNALKSIITDDTIRINEKNQPRRTAENVANFIFVSNNAYPVKIELGDRRYVVLNVNGKYKGNFTFFNQLVNSFTKEFYDNLLTYFTKYDLSTFNVRDLPMTEAKEDLIEASRSPLDEWICSHYDELCVGMLCTDALYCKPSDMKDKAFQLQIKDKCDRKRKTNDGVRKWYYVLKDECKTIYKQTNKTYLEDEYVDIDVPEHRSV